MSRCLTRTLSEVRSLHAAPFIFFMYSSKHIIEFEHLYKKGQRVWFVDSDLRSLPEKVCSGTIRLIEFDTETCNVTYFVNEYGYIDEDKLFKSKGELIKNQEWENQIELDATQGQINNLQYQLEVAKKKLSKLEKKVK